MANLSVRTDYLEILRNEAKDLGVDPVLADAIIHCESSWNTYAVRFESDFPYSDRPEKFAAYNKISLATEKALQKFSFGLGQIMGPTARFLGYEGPLTALCEPDFGIEYCLKMLKHLTDKYSRLEDIASAYNAGSVRYDEKGVYINKKYVDKVMSVYATLLKT